MIRTFLTATIEFLALTAFVCTLAVWAAIIIGA